MRTSKWSNLRLGRFRRRKIKNNIFLYISALFLDNTQRVAVISHRHFGTTYLSYLQGDRKVAPKHRKRIISVGCVIYHNSAEFFCFAAANRNRATAFCARKFSSQERKRYRGRCGKNPVGWWHKRRRNHTAAQLVPVCWDFMSEFVPLMFTCTYTFGHTCTQ